MNLGITRKEFLRVAVLGTAGLAVIPSFATTATAPAETTKSKIVYFIRPLPGKKYSRSFLKFSERMKFASAAEAVRRVKDRSQGYLLIAQLV